MQREEPRRPIIAMNRFPTTDSQLSLDLAMAPGDSLPMIAQPYRLYIERTDPARNMARFYALSIEATLFGTPILTRRWGRIGTGGQAKVHHFDRETEAVSLFLDLLRQKRARGYHTRSASSVAGKRHEKNIS